MVKVKLEDWTSFLRSRVNIDLYVWGANGERLVDILPKLCQLEKSLNDVDRTLTLLQTRLFNNVDIFEIHCEDCSGLGVWYLLKYKIIPYDMTANGLYDWIVGTDKIKPHGKKIRLSEVQAGDYLFKGSEGNKTHVGYAIDSEYAVESKDHDVGVVITKISDRPWAFAARPDWYSDAPIPTPPTPSKPVLKRELYYKNPMMRGTDVEDVQERLTELSYNCGPVDSVFGKKTDIAVRNFQSDNKLTVDGIIGRHTCEALGFIWEG